MKNNKKGFTLIELLVVIAIIGLLSTLAVVALNNARAKARDAKRIADNKQVQTALELYFNDALRYPSGATIQTGDTGSTDCLQKNGGFSTGCVQATDNPVYMATVPKGARAGELYLYTVGVNDTTYTIGFILEQENLILGSGLNCLATPSGTVCS